MSEVKISRLWHPWVSCLRSKKPKILCSEVPSLRNTSPRGKTGELSTPRELGNGEKLMAIFSPSSDSRININVWDPPRRSADIPFASPRWAATPVIELGVDVPRTAIHPENVTPARAIRFSALILEETGEVVEELTNLQPTTPLGNDCWKNL